MASKWAKARREHQHKRSLQIAREYWTGADPRLIGQKYGISASTVQFYGRRWRDLIVNERIQAHQEKSNEQPPDHDENGLGPGGLPGL